MPNDLKNTLSRKLQLKLKIVKEFDFYLDQKSVILDFGCGSGAAVQEFRENGYQTFGCDIKFKADEKVDLDSMKKRGFIRLIDLTPYKLPFQDNTFDFIFSDDVFEHVRNYRETNSELARILKPDGLCFKIRFYLIGFIGEHLKQVAFGRLNRLIGRIFKVVFRTDGKNSFLIHPKLIQF